MDAKMAGVSTKKTSGFSGHLYLTCFFHHAESGLA